MDILEILDSIKDKSLEEIKEELKKLLTAGKEDAEEFVRECTANARRWLTLKAEGKLSGEEVRSLLKSQKKVAQLFLNAQAIIARARIQKLVYRMLDIAIDIIIVVI